MKSILGINWPEEWRLKYKKRKKPADKPCWNERSSDFGKHREASQYRDIFIEYLDLEPGQRILDMGCGPGTLACPLAKQGHTVMAADFSEGMLEETIKRADEQGVAGLSVKKLDWSDNWEEAGILPKSFDVVIASRSTIVSDLADAVMKMDRTAQKMAALTITTEYAPRGYKPRGSKQKESDCFVSDFVYCVNVLIQLGAYPELRYIDIDQQEEGYPEKHLVRWAYISWEPITSLSDCST